jgi:glutaredoxin
VHSGSRLLRLRAWSQGNRRRLLLGILVLLAALLGLEHGLRWWYDPLPRQAPGQVVVYGTRWCPACVRLRGWLRESGVAFEDRDVDASPRAQTEWWTLGHPGVPVTLVGREVVRGVDVPALDAALRGAGHAVDLAALMRRDLAPPGPGGDGEEDEEGVEPFVPAAGAR